MDEDTDAVRDRAANIVGDAAAVEAFVAGREVIHRESLGRVASVTVLGALTAADRERLAAAGLEVAPVSLQQLIVRTTQHAAGAARTADRPTTDHDRPRPRRTAMNRTLSVVRMQLINKQTYIWIPLLILGGASSLALAVYAILYDSGLQGPFYGGGAQAPLWYFGIVGIQALTLTFPFSQAMSVTRREFYLGTLLTAALTSAILAAIAVVGGLIERATDGWGVNGWFFGLPWVWENGPLGAFLVNFVLAMLFFVIGFWAARSTSASGRSGSRRCSSASARCSSSGCGSSVASTRGARLRVVRRPRASSGCRCGGSCWPRVLAASAFLTLRRAVPADAASAARVGGLGVVPDDLGHDEGEPLLGELRVEVGVHREGPQACELLLLACGSDGGIPCFAFSRPTCLVARNRSASRYTSAASMLSMVARKLAGLERIVLAGRR